MPRDKRTKEWLVIVGLVILLHAVLFLTVRPSFFAMFKKTITASSEGQKAEPFAPTSVLIIPIEIEDEPSEQEQEPVQEATEPVVKEIHKKQERVIEHRVAENEPAEDSDTPIDIENVLGESPETMPNNTGPENIMIPPRALEITWPDTRKLKHCLGHHIDLKILVNDKGSIVSVEPLDYNHPPDCLRAALESANRIVFEPGVVDGVPTQMWTQVRIDFRRKR